jgi:hypothetical protein
MALAVYYFIRRHFPEKLDIPEELNDKIDSKMLFFQALGEWSMKIPVNEEVINNFIIQMYREHQAFLTEDGIEFTKKGK